MDVRPVNDEGSYAWALGQIEPYFLDEPEPGTPEGDRFDVLATLIGAYEARACPIEAADPVGVIRLVMEQTGRTQADLAELLGSRPRASEVLSGRRELSKDMIGKLSRAWKIPADLLLGASVPA
ncbi:HTH-type transcriptional regulator/antitoxin HigA [Endobacter medicaginis]|uniref:HTH-type transcriptional regulator/antitoxin HigA n=1 Tax=Endobacter medicaginis TaxID=1181271 RepID=A0A839UTP8_9PROT|nr:helix-turn-helix domain-containing protein [Endobacter medicaginis]MBB3173638.1 HTH-type transcriptional regulator/antitoxin HigA [Endobacter medicaginis]MCX5477072.1 helix-turn-helix domain-containing protein [Endobacter medicaginis]NVN31132.1 helix-turn-helix domain-containing protein [Endobacter medicaginis]